MIIFLTGASGFIGRHLAHALAAAGHQVIRAVRNREAAISQSAGCKSIEVDFTRDFETSDWLPRLMGVDVVVNAVGILREHGQQTFEAIHVRAPRALFSACAAANIKVIQLSALGADEHAQSRYHVSKRTADEHLLQTCARAVVVQPSLIFGPDGASARLFTMLASLPLIPVPDRGEQRVQPIHIDDLAQALVAIIEQDESRTCRVPLVGPQPIGLRDFLSVLRQAMGIGKGLFLPVPPAMMNLAARLAEAVPGSLFDADTLRMLRRGNTADAGITRQLLGRAPRAVADFITPREADNARTSARLAWLLPMLRFSIAFVWIYTGIVSLGLYPVEQSYALLARVGIDGWMATVALYGAALMDIAFGIAIVICKRRRMLWLAQAAVIIVYTSIITMTLPEFWLHPFGPMIKNLPMLAAIWMLYELENR